MSDAEFDEMLREALIIYMDKEMEEIPSDEELKGYQTFSPEFEKKMEALIKKSSKKYISINRFRVRKSMAAAALIIVVFSAFMSVEAIRVPVIKLSEKIYTEFSEILFNNEKNIDTPDKIEEIYVPSYIPEGYTLEEENNMTSMNIMVYSNQQEQVIFVDQYTLSVSMAVDTEGITTEEITVNGRVGIIYTKKGLTTIIINDNRYAYLISGYESREEIIRIAESLHIKK